MEVFCADAILYIFCSHITMHFQLLAYEVKQIADTSSNTSERADFKTRFKELITTHLRVVFLVNELELVYCKSTLMNFMVSSALICLTGFNVTALEDVAFVITFIGFLFITLLQVFFLCFFGEMVMNASEDICDSMYNSKWYTIDAKSAKMLLMVQIRSQRPSKLTAYGFADVNLRGFMKILSTSWSYFALLHSVYTRDAEN
ncbi:odorant receptor 67c-like [Pectinophora gossypiella]|uniref:odorant receptor 67c-like n=1 Tax=Pectinophora gossypiella TaxID=13191 RepID=UPI00214E0460|nr:odorant receptor 67c-like [Pectinophora gossypiella]